MNQDQIKGRVEEAKGKVKEVAGKVFNDTKTTASGISQQQKGKIQAGYGDAKEEIKKDLKDKH